MTDSEKNRGDVLVWICRECGKRSYAKRDPIAHHRWADTREPGGQTTGRHAVWCGPFDRYIARLDTAKPQRQPLPHFGEPIRGKEYEFVDDPNAGLVPF